MNNKWKEIWNKRSADQDKYSLDDLIKLDGFDTGAGKINENDWRYLTNKVAEVLGLQDDDTVFEVGCGAGAFLYSLLEDYDLKVGGLDYSEGLIEIAKKVMPDGNWILDEAKNIPDDQEFDYVISHGVFHYFGLSYASQVLDKMIKSARKCIAVLEVPDLDTKYEAESIRRDLLTEENYKKKYEGLEHTYYSKKWFENIAIENDLETIFLEGVIPNYAQNKYRFGVIMKKKE